MAENTNKLKDIINKITNKAEIKSSYVKRKLDEFTNDKSLGMEHLLNDKEFMSHFSDEKTVFAAIGLAMKGRLSEAYALADIGTRHANENIKGSSLGEIAGINREIFNDEVLNKFASGTFSPEDLQSLTSRLIDYSRDEGEAQEALFQPFIDMKGGVKNVNTQALTNFIVGSFLGNATLFEPNGEFVKGTKIPASDFAMFIRQGFNANMASAVNSIMSSASELANLLSEQFQIQQKINKDNIDGNSRGEVTENDIVRLIAVNSAASDTLLRLHTEGELNQIYAGSIVKKVEVMGRQNNAKRNYDSLSVMREFLQQSVKDGIIEPTGVENAVNKINELIESQRLTDDNLSSLQEEVIDELSDNSTASDMMSKIKGLSPSQMANELVSAVESTLNDGKYTGSSGSKELVLDNIKKSLYPYINGSAFYDMPLNADMNSQLKAIDRDCDAQRMLRFEQGIRECDEFIAGFIEPKPEGIESRDYESAWRKNPFQYLAKEHKEHLARILLDRPSYFGLKGGDSRVLAIRRQEIISLMNGQESSITSGELYTLLGHYQVGVTGSPQDDMLISAIRSVCTRMDYAERRSSIINSRVLEKFDLADLNLAADRTLEKFASMNATTSAQVQDALLFLFEKNQREALMNNMGKEVDGIISNPDEYSRFFSPEELKRIENLEPKAKETALREHITSQKMQEYSFYSYQDIPVTDDKGEIIDYTHTLVNEKGEPVLSSEELSEIGKDTLDELNNLYKEAQEAQQQKKNIKEGKEDGIIHTFSEPQYVPEKSEPLKKSMLANEKKAQAEIDKANKALDEQKKIKEQEEKEKLSKIAKRSETVAQGEHRIMAGLIYFLGNADNIISASGYMASMAARVNATLASHKTVERTFPGLGVCEGGIHRDTTNSLYSKYSTADDVRNMQRAFKDNGANFITAAANRLEYKFMKGALTGDAIRHMLTDQKYLNYMGIQDPRGILEELEKRGIAVPSLSHDGEIKQDINYGDRNEYQRFEESFQSMLKAQKLNLDESTIASLSDSERKIYIEKRDNFYKRFIEARMFETDGSKLRPSEMKQLFLTGALKDAPKSVRIWYNEMLKQTLATDQFGYYDQYRDSKEFLEIDNESSIEFDINKYKTTLKDVLGYLPPNAFETDRIEQYVDLLRDHGYDVSGFDLGTGKDKKSILDLLDIKGQTLESVKALEEKVVKSAQERLQDAKQMDIVIGDESKKEAYAMSGLIKDKDGNPMAYPAMVEYYDRLKVSDDPISGSEQMNAYLVNNALFIDAIRNAKLDFINGTTKEIFTKKMAEVFKSINEKYPEESPENKEALFRDLLENEGVVGLVAGKDGEMQVEGFEKPIKYMKDPIVSKSNEVSDVDLITENVGGVVVDPTQYGKLMPLSVESQIKMGNYSPGVENFLKENAKFIEDIRKAKVDFILSKGENVDTFDKSVQKIIGEIYDKFGPMGKAEAQSIMVGIMQMENVDQLSKTAMEVSDPALLKAMGRKELGMPERPFTQKEFESLKAPKPIGLVKPAVVKKEEYFSVNGHATIQILLGGKDGFIERLSKIKDAYYNGDGTRVINGNVIQENKGDKSTFCDRIADSIKQELKTIQAIKDPLTKKARMLAFKSYLYQQGITEFLQNDKDGENVLKVVKDELVEENEKLRQDDLKIEKDVEQANEDGLYKTEKEVDDAIDNLLDNPDKAENELVELVGDKEFQDKTDIEDLKAVGLEDVKTIDPDPIPVPTPPEDGPVPPIDYSGYGDGM